MLKLGIGESRGGRGEKTVRVPQREGSGEDCSCVSFYDTMEVPGTSIVVIKGPVWSEDSIASCGCHINVCSQSVRPWRDVLLSPRPHESEPRTQINGYGDDIFSELTTDLVNRLT